MKQFVYEAAAAGLAAWPSGELRLDGIAVTDNPQDADVFVCPGSLSLFQRGDGVLQHDKLYRLPHLRGHESQHVFFDVSDNFKTPINMPFIFIRCDARDWMLKTDPNTIQMGWPVEDYAECVVLPVDGFKYDVSFRGWLSSDARIDSSNACKNNPELKCDIEQYSDFTGYLKDTDPELHRRRAEFRRSMRESRVCLCPESIPGVFPYRFFEAMSAGRVPLLVASDYVFPFQSEIPYMDFILTCERSDAARADQIAQEFVRSHSDAEIVEMGRMARQSWEQWLDSRRWPQLHAYAVTAQLEARACASR